MPPITVCDGLRTSLGEITFNIIKTHIDEILLASDQEVVDAMFLIWNR
jgi:threonine dehydratase